MIQIIVTVASFAFQISGAIILLLWYIINSDRKIKQACLEDHDGILLFDMDGTTALSKEVLQAKAKVFYQNTFAFVDILMGYTCAIFADNTALCPSCIFSFVVIATVVILGIELLISRGLAKAKYSTDQRVKLDDFTPKPGTIICEEVQSRGGSNDNPS